MKVHMAVTTDKYSLPTAISASCAGLGRLLGISERTISSYLYHVKCGKIKVRYPKYISVDIDDEPLGV
ncbi:hypothetical protein [Anaerotignum propionicum]|uniref:hypothetical protein n=1 Tax=Anaerotignum propionicum TaxID=28446 RepID=UPI002897ED84|nr:hypothetical protein [Anaerotignum propionicum]